MVAILAHRAWYDLRDTAHAHGLPFDTRQNKEQAYDRLYRSLVQDGLLRRRLKELPEAERGVLAALHASDGGLLSYRFKRAYGSIRVWRPWREDVPRQPWKAPVSLAEHLWYLGFIEIVRGRPERVILPDEVVTLLPHPQPVVVPSPQNSLAICQILEVDLAAFLGAILHADYALLHGRWLSLTALRRINALLHTPDALDGVRSERQAGRLRFVHYLAEVAGLVAVQGADPPAGSG